jgi:hypothetical protein
MAAPTVDSLRKRMAEGLVLNEEAQARVREADEAERAERLEQQRAKRITQNLEHEPRLRSELAEAQADLRGLVHAIVQAIPKAREARDRHEAVARQLRHDGERCPQVASLKVQSIQDRALAHDLENLRFFIQADW